MRIGLLVIALLALSTSLAVAQPPQLQADDLATDYLTASFHEGRRDALRAAMPDGSVTVVMAYPTRTFSNDVDYVYHANPDMYYFTGYTEPHCLLFIFKEPQTAADGSTYKELFFIQKRNPQQEQWNGKRLGVEGVKSKLNMKNVFNGEEFKNFNLDLSKFSQVIFQKPPTDVEDSRYDNADLYDLIQQFKQKAALPENYASDKRVNTNQLYMQLTAGLREIKTEEEMDLLRKAAEISCIGQNEVMKAVKPSMSEREVQGLHEFIHKKYGAENVGYPSIVGAGNNGCVLHYEENSRQHIENRMVLMDVGAEYHGYTADVTRTIPANGKFTAEQKAIYEIVYNAQEAAFQLCKDGTPMADIEKAARNVVVDGLVKLGIAKTREEANKYYPHGLSHHIGLDVHDRGTYKALKKGMVITVEPGIYIPENSPCDKKWWGIAVRIEDDLLIKEKDYELLTHTAPRKAEEVEKMISQKSIFDNYTLPPLQSGKKGF